jgi:hypothetical protein
MFAPTSRYARAGTITVRTRRGAAVVATRLPVRDRPAVRVVHTRTEGQRPDHIAGHYLADATAFWRLCDATGTVSPDALAARDVVSIPSEEGGG